MKKIAVCFVVTLFLVSLEGMIAQPMNAHSETEKPGAKKAVCMVNPTQGNQVKGTITFTKVAEGIKVVADIEGLTKGKHGIHIHEFGDCSAPDASSAGGHYNPATLHHGAPDDANRHAGDMGNIEADESGKGHLEYVDKTMKLDGDMSIIGHSVIIHANADDLKTQPTGNAGGRVACGIIEAKE